MKTSFNDKGIEFDNDKVKQFFLQYRTKHLMSIANNPQNKMVEQKKRIEFWSIMRDVCSMQKDYRKSCGGSKYGSSYS